jgi:hypothetical protein
MLCNICIIGLIMRGKSGRLVLEIEPDLKRRLYSQLSADGLMLKEWFLRHVDVYLSSGKAVPRESTARRALTQTRGSRSKK